MKMKYFSIVFSFVGILALYFLSRFAQIPIVGIEEIHNYEGKQVIVQGFVLEYRTTEYGSQIIKIESNNFTANVFIEGKTQVDFGDKIQAIGEAQKYKDEWEIVVNDPAGVKILEKQQNAVILLRQLAENPSRYLGLNINVVGLVESTSNSYFYITDEERKYSLSVFYEIEQNLTISLGKKISVFGCFAFDSETFRYNLRLSEEKHYAVILEE